MTNQEAHRAYVALIQQEATNNYLRMWARHNLSVEAQLMIYREALESVEAQDREPQTQYDEGALMQAPEAQYRMAGVAGANVAGNILSARDMAVQKALARRRG